MAAHSAIPNWKWYKTLQKMNRKTKVLLLAGAAILIFIAIMAAIIIAVRPFFNIANIVSGGQ